MSGYKIQDQKGIYFITFATIEWADVFTRRDYAGGSGLINCENTMRFKSETWELLSVSSDPSEDLKQHRIIESN